MSHRHHAIDYVELAAPHQQTARSFYSQAFGWEFNDYGPDYTGIRGPDPDGPEAGGLAADGPAQPLVLIYSDDLDNTLRAVVTAGGTVLAGPYDSHRSVTRPGRSAASGTPGSAATPGWSRPTGCASSPGSPFPCGITSSVGLRARAPHRRGDRFGLAARLRSAGGQLRRMVPADRFWHLHRAPCPRCGITSTVAGPASRREKEAAGGQQAARRRLRGPGVTLLSQLAALAAIAGTGVVYGTDVFCALSRVPCVRPSTQLSRSLRHYLAHNLRLSERATAARRSPRLSADPRLGPDTTVWASTDAGFGGGAGWRHDARRV